MIRKYKLTWLILICPIIFVKCYKSKSIKEINFSYELIDSNRIVMGFNELDSTKNVKILLLDSAIREEYFYKNNVLYKYIFFDNASVDNCPKFILENTINGLKIDSGKSFYVVSKIFDNNTSINIGDTLDLIIHSAKPLFLENRLKIIENGNIILDNYSFNVNKDALNYYSVFERDGDHTYSLIYELFSKHYGFYNSDTIDFKLMLTKIIK